MFKLLQKKLNKKGFTLAELLVVIAILAILIAIAIPVFTGMVADAQLRVNQANIRSVRSAAVTKILTNLDEKDDSTAGLEMNKGVNEGDGWVALAKVDNAGNVTDLEVYVQYTISNYHDGIIIGDNGTPYAYSKDTGKLFTTAEESGSKVFYPSLGTETTTSGLAAISPKSGSTQSDQVSYYVVQCVIKDIDIDNTPPKVTTGP